MTNQIGSLDSELLSSSTVALCVQISAMLVTYSATKFSLNTPVQSERYFIIIKMFYQTIFYYCIIQASGILAGRM